MLCVFGESRRSNNNTLEQVLKHPFVKAAAAKLKASGGRSPMLAELVVSSMDAIDKLRDEQRAAQMREAERRKIRCFCCRESG